MQSTARETAWSASPAEACTDSSLRSHARRTMSLQLDGRVDGEEGEDGGEEGGEGAELARAERAAERTRWLRARERVEGWRAQTAV